MARNRIALRRGTRGGKGVYFPFTITGVVPAFVNAGAASTALRVLGANFPAGAVVYVDGVAQTTAFVTATELDFTLSAADAAVPGFKVFQVKSGLLHSNSFAYPVNFPVPGLTSLTPAFAYVGEGSATPTAAGSGFYPSGTDAFLDGINIVFAYTSLSAGAITVASGIIDVAGDHGVVIVNPMPGGGVTAPVLFQGRYRAPTLAALPLAGTPINSGDVVMTLTGTNFYNPAAWAGGGSVGQVDGVTVPSTWLSPTTLQITVPAAVTAVAGNKAITILNPTAGGGGGPSASRTFAVGYPAPAIVSLSPNRIDFNAAPTVVVVEMTNAYPATVARVGGVDQVTTYVDPTHVSFIFTPSIIQQVSVTVFNPTAGGGGGSSSALPLTITVALTTMTITSATQRDNGVTEVVTGAGFTNGTSIVRLNGTNLTTTFISSTMLSAVIPTSMFAAAGTMLVDVFDTYASGSLNLVVAPWTPGSSAGATMYNNTQNITESPSGFCAALAPLVGTFTADQPTLANRPAYTASDPNFNGKPSVARTTDVQFLQMPFWDTAISPTAGTILLLARSTAFVGGLTDLISVASGGTYGLYQQSATVVISRNFSGGQQATPSNTFVAGAATKFEWRHAGGTLYSRVNNVQQSVASGTATVAGAGMRIFATGAGCYAAFTEAVILNQDIAANDRTRWDNYCFQEYLV